MTAPSFNETVPESAEENTFDPIESEPVTANSTLEETEGDLQEVTEPAE